MLGGLTKIIYYIPILFFTRKPIFGLKSRSRTPIVGVIICFRAHNLMRILGMEVNRTREFSQSVNYRFSENFQGSYNIFYNMVITGKTV